MSPDAALLEVRSVAKRYHAGVGGRRVVEAVRNVSLSIGVGERVGLVGQSGSGKTTLARLMLLAERPTVGEVLFDGTDITGLRRRRELLDFRRAVQVISQGCEDALNPRFTIAQSLREVYRVLGREEYGAVSRNQLEARARLVGLHAEHLDRYPDQLSGGQLQRVIIARVMSLSPRLIIADEPTANLDVSVQAQIIHLLLDLHRRRGFALLLISHDLNLVGAIASHILVMREGEIVETGDAGRIAGSPNHPYTRALMDAAARSNL